MFKDNNKNTRTTSITFHTLKMLILIEKFTTSKRFTRQIYKEKIRYRIKAKIDFETFFEIEATISNGGCGNSIRKEDFLNDKAHSFERRGIFIINNEFISRNINLIQYGQPDLGGRRYLFPFK